MEPLAGSRIDLGDNRAECWSALPGDTQPCHRCGAQPAVVRVSASRFCRLCADCARLAGCPATVIGEGLRAHGPRSRIHGLTSAHQTAAPAALQADSRG